MVKNNLIVKISLLLFVLIVFNQCFVFRAPRTPPAPVMEPPGPKPEPKPEPKSEPKPEPKPVSKPALFQDIDKGAQFPFPVVPQPSADVDLTVHFKEAYKLKDIDYMLITALDKNGYYRRTYLEVDAGFALVTQLEQIDEKGFSIPDPDRWNYRVTTNLFEGFSLGKYFKALFNAKAGYYRCIVFLVTPNNFTFSGESPDKVQSDKWFRVGLQKLPAEIKELTVTPEYTVTALIYEFKKSENKDEAKFLLPDECSCNNHLANSGILKSLAK